MGLVHLKLGKLLKSLSVEYKRAPCSIAKAARCASEVRFAAVPRGRISSFRMDQCLSVGTISTAGDWLSHSSTISVAVSDERGLGIILPLVTILKKPKITIQAKPKGSSFDRDSSSHFFAFG